MQKRTKTQKDDYQIIKTYLISCSTRVVDLFFLI